MPAATDERSAYAEARRRGQEVVRRALLGAASEIRVEEGPRALTVRRAAAVASSTTVLSTLVGGEAGLLDALDREGVERFRRRLEAAADLAVGTEPIARQVAPARAYRASALADPHYHRVMVVGAIPGFAPSGEAMVAGILHPSDPDAVAEVL